MIVSKVKASMRRFESSDVIPRFVNEEKDENICVEDWKRRRRAAEIVSGKGVTSSIGGGSVGVKSCRKLIEATVTFKLDTQWAKTCCFNAYMLTVSMAWQRSSWTSIARFHFSNS